MIQVTKPFLPPREEYEKYVRDIWDRCWLTNNGPLVVELESKLREYLRVANIFYVSNGTVALQLAIKALALKGEIITTPFSYVATTTSIIWEGCTPVFVDIDKDTLNIDPGKIEQVISEHTSGILATHVYGNPCDIDRIEIIAKKYNLKVIYDAAHGFGSKFRGQSIYNFGDIATASFHSTKLFHTIEGGAVFANDQEIVRKLSYMRNFGHIGDDYQFIGINGKNSEFHAAMGIVNLRYINDILTKRKELSVRYDDQLAGLNLKKPLINHEVEYNYAYYPIIAESEDLMTRIIKSLNDAEIYPRRYFFPSLNTLPYVSPCHAPVSESISNRVFCLPLFFDLKKGEVDLISSIIRKAC